MKALKFIFVSIPNFPFALIMVCYIGYKVAVVNGYERLSAMGKIPVTEELVSYIKRIYPIHLKIFISVIFWLCISFLLYNHLVV